MKPRCDNCKFWDTKSQAKERYNKDRHADDRQGTCRRHAPNPSHGDFQYAVLWFLFQECKVRDNLPNWEETETEPSGWPTTCADHWCGEFKPQPRKTRR